MKTPEEQDETAKLKKRIKKLDKALTEVTVSDVMHRAFVIRIRKYTRIGMRGSREILSVKEKLLSLRILNSFLIPNTGNEVSKQN